MEKKSAFTIELPKIGDEAPLAPMHIRAWKETYITPESGVTEKMVDEMIGHLLTNTDFRKDTIVAALANPDLILYRVVKNIHGDIVGFMHAHKEAEFTELDAIYLLNEAKGTGIGTRLMEEFLSWSDKSKPCFLEVFSFNDHALEFYKKHGFVKTEKPP